jgi:hypothetical protein
MPSECASIGDNPGPTDHLYNAGSGRRFWSNDLLKGDRWRFRLTNSPVTAACGSFGEIVRRCCTSSEGEFFVPRYEPASCARISL